MGVYMVYHLIQRPMGVYMVYHLIQRPVGVYTVMHHLVQEPMGVYTVMHHLMQGPMGVYSVYIPVHLHDGTLLIGHAERVVDGMLEQLLHLACEGDIFLEMLLCVWCVCVCVCVCMRVRVIYPCQNFPLHVPSTHMKMLAYPVFEGEEDSRDVDTRLHG